MLGFFKLNRMKEVVHIWQMRLDVPSHEIESAFSILSHPERARAARFRDPTLGHRYAVCRAAVRRLLGERLDRHPKSLEFTLTPYSKPELIDLSLHQLHFNVTHSSDLAMIGLRQGGPLGIDIERIRPDFATDEIAARFFSPREFATLQSIPPMLRAEAFFRIWTRKEAFIKAIGEGMSHPLDAFDVNLCRHAPAILAVDGDAERAADWTLREIDVPAGFIGALAAEGRVTQVTIHEGCVR